MFARRETLKIRSQTNVRYLQWPPVFRDYFCSENIAVSDKTSAIWRCPLKKVYYVYVVFNRPNRRNSSTILITNVKINMEILSYVSFVNICPMRLRGNMRQAIGRWKSFEWETAIFAPTLIHFVEIGFCARDRNTLIAANAYFNDSSSFLRFCARECCSKNSNINNKTIENRRRPPFLARFSSAPIAILHKNYRQPRRSR